MRNLILPILLITSIILLSAHGANTTIFFDDFTTSGFPSQWTNGPTTQGAGNVTQNGGYLFLTAPRSTLPVSTSTDTMVANVSGKPIIGPNTPDGQFIFIAWKMQPFNMTNVSAPNIRTSQLLFGLANPQNQFANLIWFDVSSSDNGGVRGMNGAKSTVTFDILRPMPTGTITSCYASGTVVDFSGACQSPQKSIQYSTPQSFDLNAQHTFIMELKLYPVSHTSWIAFQVDNNAWMNMTQQACACIDQPAAGGSYAAMYPFIYIAYTATAACCYPGSTLVFPNQSVTASIDWVLVTDFVPPSTPIGQLLFSNTHPPAKLPNPYNINGPSDSLVGFMQFQANSIAPGNIFAGGLLLTGIIVTIIGGTLGAIIYRTKRGIREMGFMWSLSSLGIVFFNFYCGIVPLWLPAIQTILSAGIIFGIIRTGSISGGIVPD